MSKMSLKKALLKNFRRAENSVIWAMNDEILPYWYQPLLDSLRKSLESMLAKIKSMGDEEGELENMKAVAKRLKLSEKTAARRAIRLERRSEVLPIMGHGKSGLYIPGVLTRGKPGRKHGSKNRKGEH